MAMVENLIKQNPQLNNAWQIARQLSQNTNKQEVINQIAKQKGISCDDVKEMANKFGINV